MEDRTIVLLGNTNPQMQRQRPVIENNEVVGTEQFSEPAEHLDQSVTRVEMREGFDDVEETELALSTENDRMLSMIARSLGDEHRHYAIGVNEVEQIMAVHSAGTAPAWVESDDKEFEAALAQHFGCAQGEQTMLLTNAGRDALHTQHINTTATPAAFQYMALTANATAPSAASTSLTAEIATASGGLVRATATPAHTGGTNTSTLTKTFTANGNDVVPVTIAKIGIFNAASGVTLGYETLLNATATLTVSGDNVAITETVTIG